MTMQPVGLTAKIEGLSAFEAAARKVNQHGKDLGEQFDKTAQHSEGMATKIGHAFTNVGKVVAIGAAAATAAFAAVGVASISAAANFESTISSIKAVSGATATEIEQVSKLALQLGKDTSFSASQAAAGIEELIKGGISIPDVMNGAAEAMLNLAAAGGVSLPDAAEIAANALAMFNLKGADMAHVADLIAGAANASSLSVSDFKFSLAASGAVAAASGQNFDDLAQAIAVLGQAGLKGADAGTSLKTFLMNLQPTTKKATETMRELGLVTTQATAIYNDLVARGVSPAIAALEDNEEQLKKMVTGWDGKKKITQDQQDTWAKYAQKVGITTNAFIDAEGKFKSMSEISGILQKATEGLTDAEKMMALEVMFGSDAIRAAAIFAKAGEKGFTDMAASMGKVTAASVGAEKLNNLKGSIEQLKGSLETAAITLGMAFLPKLRDVTDGVTKAVNAVMPWIERVAPQFADKLGEMAKEASNLAGQLVRDFGPTLQRVAGDVGHALGVMGDVIQAVFKNDAKGAMDAFLAGFWKPLTDAGVDVLEVRNKILEFGKALEGGFKNAVETARRVIADLQQANTDLKPTWDRLGTAVDAVKTAIDAVLPPIRDAITNLGAMAGEAADGKDPLDALVAAINATSEAIENVIKWIRDNVVVQAVLVTGLTAVTAAWALSTAAAIAHQVATNLAAAATGAYTAAQWLLNAALTANPIGIVVVALAALAAGLVYAYNNSEDFRRIADQVFSFLRDVAIAVIGQVQAELARLSKNFEDTRTAVETFWNALLTLNTIFDQVVTQALNLGRAMLQGILDGLSGLAGAVGNLLTQGLGGAVDQARKILGIGSPSKVMQIIGAQMIEGLTLGITEAGRTFNEVFHRVFDETFEWWDREGLNLFDFMRAQAEQFARDQASNMAFVFDEMKGGRKGIEDLMKVLEQMYGGLAKIVSPLMDIMDLIAAPVTKEYEDAIAAVNAQLKEQNTVYADQMDALADWSRYRQNVHDAEMATINDEIDLLRDKIALEQQPFLDKQMAANEEYQKLQAEGNVADLYFAREREKAHTTGDKKRLEDLKLEEDSYRDNQRYRLDVLRAEMAVSKDQMDAVTDRHAAELTALQAEQAAKKDAWDAEQDAIKRRREALEATNKVQREAAAERLKEIAAEEKAALLANQTIQGLLDTISALQAKTAELEMIKTVSLIANTLSSAGMQIPQAVLAAFAALPREAGGMLDSVINALLAAYGRGLYGAAEGAVVTRPTMLMAGEGGEPEAILPLSSLRGLVDSVLSRVLGGRVGMPMPGAMLRAGGGSTFTQQRTYQLSASYAQVQSESSIMLDLQAMEMLAGARG